MRPFFSVDDVARAKQGPHCASDVRRPYASRGCFGNAALAWDECGFDDGASSCGDGK